MWTSSVQSIKRAHKEMWIKSTSINPLNTIYMFTAFAFATAAYGIYRVSRYFR